MSREASHYVVTAHPPNGVLHTVKCNFLAADSEVSNKSATEHCYHCLCRSLHSHFTIVSKNFVDIIF